MQEPRRPVERLWPTSPATNVRPTDSLFVMNELNATVVGEGLAKLLRK